MTQGFTNQISLTNVPVVSSGAGAPASTPGKVGDIYVDTTAKRKYIATGTASSADWLKEPVFYTTTFTITGSGGDITITLPWDWTGGMGEMRFSTNTGRYVDDAAGYNFRFSYDALTAAGYTSNQNFYDGNAGNGVMTKTTNFRACPKSATSTTIVFDDDGTTAYCKLFVWA